MRSIWTIWHKSLPSDLIFVMVSSSLRWAIAQSAIRFPSATGDYFAAALVFKVEPLRGSKVTLRFELTARGALRRV
jgi:hypothetical protein